MDGRTIGRPVQAGFVGVSLEFSALPAYAGNSAASLNPVFVQLIRNLAGGQAPQLRIGGDSTDWTWWPVNGAVQPRIVNYALTPNWLGTVRALAQALGAGVVLGINLAMDQPSLAAAEARAMLAGVGPSSVSALEIGNEGDVYNRFPVYRAANGRVVPVRASSYDVPTFVDEFSRTRRALPPVPVAGPTFGNVGWMRKLAGFLDAEPGLGLVTFHRYPLNCFAAPGSAEYPGLANLLSNHASDGLAQGVTHFVALAHARGARFRVDELNSVACAGKSGVSNTFASALWMLDTLFGMARVGVDGINVHTLPNSRYELFTFQHTLGSNDAFVHPDYYGMLMFARAAPPGSHLLSIGGSVPPGVKLWATRAPDRKVRLVLINKNPSLSRTVLVRVRGATGAGTLDRLLAPSISATSGVTLGGQTFGAGTSTGQLAGQRRTTRISPVAGTYAVTLPAASAAMLTL